jgi:hypothetical protein
MAWRKRKMYERENSSQWTNETRHRTFACDRLIDDKLVSNDSKHRQGLTLMIFMGGIKHSSSSFHCAGAVWRYFLWPMKWDLTWLRRDSRCEKELGVDSLELPLVRTFAEIFCDVRWWNECCSSTRVAAWFERILLSDRCRLRRLVRVNVARTWRSNERERSCSCLCPCSLFARDSSSELSLNILKYVQVSSLNAILAVQECRRDNEEETKAKQKNDSNE